MEAIDTRQVGPLTVELHHDPFPDDDPRDWTNVSTWVELRAEQVEELWYEPEKVADYLREHYGARHIVAVTTGSGAQPYVNSHEVSELATAQHVDYWQIDTPKGRKDVYGGSAYVPEEAVRKIMDEERGLFEAWFCGEVYGWTVTDARGEHLESVWGCIGESDYAMSEGIGTAEAILKQAAKRLDGLGFDTHGEDVIARYALVTDDNWSGRSLTVYDSPEEATELGDPNVGAMLTDLYTGDEFDAVAAVKFVKREREEVAS